MMIKLTENLVLDADDNQYILGKLTTRRDKDGNEVESIKNPSYFTSMLTTLKFAVAWCMRLKIKEGSVTTLRQYLDEQVKVQEEFEKLIEPFDLKEEIHK